MQRESAPRNELEPSPTPTEESKLSRNTNTLLSRSGWQPRIPRPAFAKHNYKPSVISTKTLRVSLPCLHSHHTLIRFDKTRRNDRTGPKLAGWVLFWLSFSDTYKWTHSHGIWGEISVTHVTACWEPHKEVWKYDLKSRLSCQPIIRRACKLRTNVPVQLSNLIQAVWLAGRDLWWLHSATDTVAAQQQGDV